MIYFCWSEAFLHWDGCSQQKPYVLRNKVHFWIGPPFYTKNTRCAGWRKIIMRTTHYKAKWTSTSPATSSAQAQRFPASLTLQNSLTKRHISCVPSQTHRGSVCPVFWVLRRGRLELQESLSCCLQCPEVFSLKFTEIFLGKDSALRLLLCLLLWRSIFGLPTSVLGENLQMEREKQQLLLVRPGHKTDFQAHLPCPCHSAGTLLHSGMPPQRNSRRHWIQRKANADVNQSRSRRQQQISM